jgi:hypothetical protein
MAQSVLPAKISQLEKVYNVEEEVRPFLADRPELVDLLLEARPHFERHFGSDVVVKLRFPIRFPGETDEDLFARIQSPFDVETSKAKFDKFWDAWFGEASGRPEAFPLYIAVDEVGELP